jgi:hypothetical protein
MPGLGISNSLPLLVYQRDHLPWGGSGKLEQENGNVQEMRRFSVCNGQCRTGILNPPFPQYDPIF